MANTGLPVSRVVNVNLNLSPSAAAFANFNSCMIFGTSSVIDVDERYRSYGSITEVADDFGTSAPEYLAALLFFSQLPTPTQLYIARWAEAATPGILYCGLLTAAEQVISNWTSITAGSFKVAIDGGSATNIGSLDFHLQTTLTGIAAVIQTAVRAIGTGGFTAATVVWNGAQFIITSGTTGGSSTVSYMTAGNANDISAQLMGTSDTAENIVAGIAAETAVAAVEILDDMVQFYTLTFAWDFDSDNPSVEAVAAYVEADGTTNPHIFGVTTAQAAALSSSDTTSIGYLLKQLAYERTFCQWSETLYAAASLLGRGVTVDFTAQNSTINFKFKTEPGVVPETLTSSQANALDKNNYNYYVNYNNGTAIICNGNVAGGHFIDEIWNLDWYCNQIQTDVFNLFYQTPKVPQTDAGMGMIAGQITQASNAAVNNGTLGPGTWTSVGFGQLKQGDFLPTGFYIYQPPVAIQASADRALRKSVPFQIAAKLAGAVNSTNISVNVNQ